MLLGTTPFEEQHHGKLMENLRNIIGNIWEHDGNTRKIILKILNLKKFHHHLPLPPKEEKMKPLELNVCLVHLIVYICIFSNPRHDCHHLFIYLFLPQVNTPSTKHTTITMDDDDEEEEESSIPSYPSSCTQRKLSYTLLESCCCCLSTLMDRPFNTYLLPYPTISRASVQVIWPPNCKYTYYYGLQIHPFKSPQ